MGLPEKYWRKIKMDKLIKEKFGIGKALSEYTYGRDNQKKGILVAFPGKLHPYYFSKAIEVCPDKISEIRKIKCFLVGWSLCCPEDKFDDIKGRYIALERAVNQENVSAILDRFMEKNSFTQEEINFLTGQYCETIYSLIPNSIRAQFNKFYCRCLRYYKDCLEPPQYVTCRIGRLKPLDI